MLRAHGDVGRAVAQLGSRSVIRRVRAAHVLGLVRDPDHVPDLIPLLSDGSAEVRLVAVRALGAIGDPAAAASVLAALSPVRGQVGVPASAAAEALVAMGSGTGQAVRAGLRSPDPVVRAVACLVAGRSTLVAAAVEMRELLDRDPDSEVRVTAAVALGLVGGPQDVETLSRHTTVDTPAPLRRTCAAALGDLGHPLAVEAVLPLLASRDRRLAEISAQSLIRLGPVGLTRLAEVPDAGAAGRAARAALAAARLPEVHAVTG